MANKKASIYIKHGDKKGLYLYTNKDGDKLPKILGDALKRGKERWGDTATMTRIIFSEMIQRDVFGTNSYAISPHLMDNENFILVVDDQIEKVGVFGESGYKYAEYTFDQYLALNNADWPTIANRFRFEDDTGVNRRKTDPYQF